MDCYNCIYKRKSYCSKTKVARIKRNKCCFKKTYKDTLGDLENELKNLEWYYSVCKIESTKIKIKKLKEEIEKIKSK